MSCRKGSRERPTGRRAAHHGNAWSGVRQNQQMKETPDVHGAFPRLSEAQIAALTADGAWQRTAVGDILFREGQTDCDFFVIGSGMVALVEGYGTDDEV